MRLNKKIALITGGANGIGLATAERFAKEGAKIILWDLSEKGNEVVGRLKQEGHEAIFTKVSVTNDEEVQAAVAEARAHFGRIDILINNAGITKDRTLLKMSKQEWDDVIAVNLTGVFNCIAPGFIHMAMTDAMPEAVREQSLPLIPLGKWGYPEDIANGYLFLASDEASFVSGICLRIDGGASR
jgi:NAD(P)-dependent dehydrogenase (short-subunit alcohol dehydrogenase family)